MVARPIVRIVQQYLNECRKNGVEVSFGVVFGSYVTGRADQDSDIDLVVVAQSIPADEDADTVSLLWCLAAVTDSRIEPILCTDDEWKHDDSSAIIEIARRHGERVDLESAPTPA